MNEQVRPQIATVEASSQTLMPISATIFIVDDEEMITRLQERQFRKWGYQTIVSNTIPTALSIVDSDQTFDLVISDYFMPQMNGSVFAEYVHRKRPGTPIIVCSGDLLPLQNVDLGAIGIAAVVQKPVQSKALLEAVKSVLAGTKP